MASHKGWDRHYPVKTVAKSGGTFNLAKGQLALVDMNAQPTPAGLKIVSNIAGKSKDNQYQLRLGKMPVFNNRSQSSKDWSSETFKVTDILGLKVNVPTEGIKTDEFILGYDGFDPNTAITLEPGDNEEIGLTLSGEVIGAIGYQDATVEIKTYLTAAANGSTTNQEIVETAVKHLKNYQLYGNVPLSNYVDIQAINSENSSPATGSTASAFYSITVEDRGDGSALAAVQAQFNGVKVVRSNFEAGESTYTVIAAPSEIVAATALVIGQEYEIATTGDTDFTAVGAADSNVGTKFVATGAGTGTGTALTIVLADFSKFKNIKIKGCEDCPAGYSALTEGFLYSVSLEDDGADEVATVEGIGNGVVADSTVKVNQDNGEGTYTLVSTDELTEAQIEAFVTANPTAVVKSLGEVAGACSPDASETFTWLEGDSCYARTEVFTIVVPDGDNCGDNQLDALQTAYPSLEITVVSAAQCQTKFTASVTTGLVCEECSDAYQDLFVAEAPENYGPYTWKAEAKVYDENALMGIRFKAKEIVLAGTEEYRDDMPNFATSARIAVSGGVYRNVNETFNVGTNGRFAGRVISIASSPENWGLNLRQYEDITRRYEEGTSRHEGNNYAKYVLGEESLLEPTQAYIDYVLTVRIEKMAQSLGGILVETFYYHYLVAPGAHADVEEVLNALASKAGVPTVQALGKV